MRTITRPATWGTGTLCELLSLGIASTSFAMLRRCTSRTPRYETPKTAAKIGTLVIIQDAGRQKAKPLCQKELSYIEQNDSIGVKQQKICPRKGRKELNQRTGRLPAKGRE